MKKYRHILLIALLALGLSACSQNKETPEPDLSQSNAVVPETVPAVETAPGTDEKVLEGNSGTAEATENAPELAETGVAEAVLNAEPSADPEPDGSEEADEGAGHRIDSLDPLSEEQKDKLSKITWDVDPEVLNAVEKANEGGHFPYTDELHLDLFEEHIRNLGGTYMGVGTDQGYLFIGWQRPTLALMTDYDPWVVIIHKFYMAFWKQCDNAACLQSYFADKEKGLAWINSEAGVAEGLNKPLPVEVYKKLHGVLARQLKRLERSKMQNFMNDTDTFMYIKNLIEAGRIRTLQANLLGDKAFASIASTLDELGAKVTTLYLSNAEQYWGYSPQFKKNIIGLPAYDNALILRTSATKPSNNDYRYSIQPIHVFKAWLQHPDGKSVRQVTKRVRIKDPEDFPFVIDDFMPPEIQPGGKE